MQVEVRPIDIEKWHGHTGSDSIKQPITIEALYDAETGGYATGLTEEEAREYGRKLGVDLSATYNQEREHEFWGTKSSNVKLENNTMFFDDTKAIDFVKIKMLKASNRVANSLKEYQDGKFPDATHYIYDESEEVDAEATKFEKETKAFGILANMNSDDKASIVQIIANKTVRGMKPNFIDAEISKIVKAELDEFLRITALDPKDVYLRAQVLEAVHRGILNKTGSNIQFMGDTIGYNLEAAIEYLKKPDNQQQKVSILSKLTA